MKALHLGFVSMITEDYSEQFGFGCDNCYNCVSCNCDCWCDYDRVSRDMKAEPFAGAGIQAECRLEAR